MESWAPDDPRTRDEIASEVQRLRDLAADVLRLIAGRDGRAYHRAAELAAAVLDETAPIAEVDELESGGAV